MSKRKIIEETEQPNKKSKYDIKWENYRLRLIEFYEKYGHYNVPTRWEEDRQLGNWVHRQKTEFRKYNMDPSKSWLSAERVSLLKEMGAIDSWFTASLIRSMDTEKRTWEESCALLKAYRDAHGGDCNIPAKWKDDPQLGGWVHRQKAQFRMYKVDPAMSWLNAERISSLEKIGAIKSWFPSNKI